MAFTGVVINITTKVSGHLDDEAFGAAYALVTIVFGAGLAVGPQLGGIIADYSGSFRPALIVAACCAALGLCSDPRRPKVRNKQSSRPEYLNVRALVLVLVIRA